MPSIQFSMSGTSIVSEWHLVSSLNSHCLVFHHIPHLLSTVIGATGSGWGHDMHKQWLVLWNWANDLLHGVALTWLGGEHVVIRDYAANIHWINNHNLPFHKSLIHNTLLCQETWEKVNNWGWSPNLKSVLSRFLECITENPIDHKCAVAPNILCVIKLAKCLGTSNTNTSCLRCQW